MSSISFGQRISLTFHPQVFVCPEGRFHVPVHVRVESRSECVCVFLLSELSMSFSFRGSCFNGVMIHSVFALFS